MDIGKEAKKLMKMLDNANISYKTNGCREWNGYRFDGMKYRSIFSDLEIKQKNDGSLSIFDYHHNMSSKNLTAKDVFEYILEKEISSTSQEIINANTHLERLQAIKEEVMKQEEIEEDGMEMGE
jgi:hypothetical protein